MSSSVNGQALDHEQRAAVESRERAIAVLAGPGSGKTRVLAHRARFLLGSQPGDRALLLTFTNKAAAEMKARAIHASTVSTDRLWASTFHTFALHLLQNHGECVGVPPDVEVLDDEERKDLVARLVVSGHILDRYDEWSFHRVRRIDVPRDDIAEFGAAYQAAKQDETVIDFDDIAVLAAQLLERNQEVAEAYGARYRHILVDEFQDTNASQFAIVQALAPHSATIGVFADDDQAIYQFAGADARNVRRFIHQLGAHEYPLTVNYRCREAIVGRANRLIATDARASGRQMTARYPGGEVRVHEFASGFEEASDVADEIAQYTSGPASIKPQDIAVLSRSRARLTAVAAELNRRGVPVTSWLSGSYETAAKRSLRTVLGIVRGTLSERQRKSLGKLFSFEMVETTDPEQFLAGQSESVVANELEKLRALAWEGGSASDVVAAACHAVTLADPTMEDAMDDINESVRAFEAADSSFSLEHVLAELALGGVGGPPASTGGVKVATLHRTKGLQWPFVYIVGLEEGKLPDFRARTPEAVSEERRACFVGVCRAEHQLTLTVTSSFGGYSQARSRFLAEMGL